MKDRNTYDHLIENFGSEVLADRYMFLKKYASKFIEIIDAKDYFHIQPRIINEILVDYFSDIARLKSFHNIERSNPQKVASYTAYWVAKRKPIQFKENVNMDSLPADRSAQLSDINEWFSAILFYSMLYDHNAGIFDQSSEDLYSFTNFLKSLNYFFTYRLFNPQALEMIAYALEVTPRHPKIVDVFDHIDFENNPKKTK